MEKANGWFKQSRGFSRKIQWSEMGKGTAGYFQGETNEIRIITKEIDEKRNGG